MRDPSRLDEGEATAFERRLLDAAKRPVPDAALKARMQAGLGLAGPTLPAPVVAKSFALGWKAKIVLGLVAVGTSVTVPLVLRDRRPVLSPPTAQVITPTPPAAVEPPADEISAAGSLTEEIRLLDRIRGAMSAGEPRRALTELQRYDERYPRGLFRPEATVLRVEALDKAGDSRAAKLLGQWFLAQHPKNPLADRVARIVRR